MAVSTRDKFTGFTPETLEFLRALAANNRRDWFEAQREEYRLFLQEPLQLLASALTGPLLAIDPDLLTEPRRVVSRIYRDIRFSADKSPYKTSMWLTFKRPITAWQDSPSFFFEISADSYRYGMGFFNASRDTMDRLRQVIDRKPEDFRGAIAFLARQSSFVPEGEQYKRLLDGTKDEDLLDWYQRKNLYLVCNRSLDGCLFNRGLLDELTAGFSKLAPFYHWLRQLKSR